MEQQTHYLMWLRSKQIFKSHYQSSMNSLKNSWEEQAFAEDIVAAGPLGSGLVWPPRSYSCTFCTREFRSAQALGGHMNVHRRDRARLKQSLQEHQTPSTLSLRVETNLSMGQILGVDNKETIKSKRQKSTDISSFASCSSSSSDRYVFGKPEMLRIKSNGLEDNIDLELRLGDPPAIK